MNCTFQSFNFRHRHGARPFYDLIANIAAEEYGHIELVAAAINSMLTDPSKVDDRGPDASLSDFKGRGLPQHFLAGGQGALPQDSQGRAWTGDYVFSSGDPAAHRPGRPPPALSLLAVGLPGDRRGVQRPAPGDR